LERQAQTERLCLEALKRQNIAAPYAVKNGWSWPIKDITELDEAEEYLKSASNFEQEVSDLSVIYEPLALVLNFNAPIKRFQVLKLSRIGGPNINKTVYNTLHWIIDDDVALQLRLTDKSGKTPFNGRLLAKLVRGKK